MLHSVSIGDRPCLNSGRPWVLPGNQPCQLWSNPGTPTATPLKRLVASVMRVASHSDQSLDVGGSLPAFVERAQEDARSRQALSRMGYRRVKAAFSRQLRDAPEADTFHGLERDLIWPSMDFVREWLKAEKRNHMARARRPFLAAMLVTILAGLGFVGAVYMLG